MRGGRRWVWRGGAALLAATVLAALALLGLVRIAGWETLPEPPGQAQVRLLAGDRELAVFQGPPGQRQLWVPLPEVPQAVVNAVLMAEDRRFFDHHGVDPAAVARALWANLRSRRVAQGASTITQQLARTLYLTPERTLWRKLRESLIALALEARYDKARILEAYLNAVYMGHDGGLPVYGLPAAARQFLNKDVRTVRLDEAAMLAAAINAPNKLLADRMRLGTRRDAILQAMREEGLADPGAVKAALVRPPRWHLAAHEAAYFVDVAREEIGRRLALPRSGDVRIATALDPALQRAAEAAIDKGVKRLERRSGREGGGVQAALVALEPASGRIRALVGGRAYAESAFNRATKAVRQPGSLFKPFVYLAAFESSRADRFTPASIVIDEPLEIRTTDGPWAPANATGRFEGAVTIRRAIEESLNIPAVRIAGEIGPARVAEVAHALGIVSPLAAVPSLALGSSEVSLLEIVTAFATIANGGVKVPPTTLAADPGYARPGESRAPARVVSAQSAFLVTHLLRGVMRNGTGRASVNWGLSDVTAGKTGSTNGLRDAWFVGYTSELVVGVWVGRDDGSPLGLSGAQAALPIWADVMQSAIRRAAPPPFTAPEGVVFAAVSRDTGKRASFWCGESGPVVQEAFRAGTEPGTACSGFPLQRLGDTFVGWVRGLFRKTPPPAPAR